MADVALIFGWAPPAMDPMTLPDLMGWRERAIKRHNPKE